MTRITTRDQLAKAIAAAAKDARDGQGRKMPAQRTIFIGLVL